MKFNNNNQKITLTVGQIKQMVLEASAEAFRKTIKQTYPWLDKEMQNKIFMLYASEDWFPNTSEDLKDDIFDIVHARCAAARGKAILDAIKEPGTDTVGIPWTTVDRCVSGAAEVLGAKNVKIKISSNNSEFLVFADDIDKETFADTIAQETEREGLDVDVWDANGAVHIALPETAGDTDVYDNIMIAE